MDRKAVLMEMCQTYTTQGWVLVPVLPREKRPGWDGKVQGDWQNLRLTLDELGLRLQPDSNLGVILGESSGGLVDVDCDCAEAVALAPLILPETWTFGRVSRPRSHWLYASHGVDTTQYRALPEKDNGGKTPMLVELRSTGGQTVIPPSVHRETGEAIEWSEDGGGASAPRVIDASELREAARTLACVSLFARYSSLDAAREWIRAGVAPPMPEPVALRIRQWMGLAVLRAEERRGYVPGREIGNAVERARLYLRKVRPAISGAGGHNATFLAAQHLVKGFGLNDSQALELLLTEYNQRCEPPWSESELAHKVKEARERGNTVDDGKHLVRP